MELPEYKKMVLDSLDGLLSISSPYCGEGSPLPQEISATLDGRMERAKSVCKERMEKFKPKIMLYGVYNSGKSTLLNALLGKKLAEVGDIPKTAESTSYDWYGHELVDTPGIDAPIEHEEISRDTLRASQIILFVMSARGSFEHNKIYEAMRDVVEQGKRLIIVLNNKDDEHTADGLTEIKERIQKILEENGFTRQQAASFRLVLVNAQYGMEGRMGGDEQLVEYSGIKELEEILYNEINKTNGYALVKDALKDLLLDYRFLLDNLQKHVNANDSGQAEAMYDLHKQYQDFLAGLENSVDTECSVLTEEIRHCFPAAGADVSAFSSEGIKSCINKLLEDCLESINSKIASESESFMNILARQGQRILESGERSVEFETEFENYEGLIEALQKYQKEAEPGRAPTYNDSDMLEKIGNTAATLSSLPMMKLPIPLPIPPVVISVVLMGIKIIASIFSKSDAEKERERMEAQIAYEREVAEKQARAQERQREEIKSYAEDVKAKFVRGVKIGLRENIAKKFMPVLDALEAQCHATSQLSEKIHQDISRLQDNILDINTAISEIA